MKKNLSMIAIIIAAVIVVLSVVIGTRFGSDLGKYDIIRISSTKEISLEKAQAAASGLGIRDLKVVTAKENFNSQVIITGKEVSDKDAETILAEIKKDNEDAYLRSTGSASNSEKTGFIIKMFIVMAIIAVLTSAFCAYRLGMKAGIFLLVSEICAAVLSVCINSLAGIAVSYNTVVGGSLIALCVTVVFYYSVVARMDLRGSNRGNSDTEGLYSEAVKNSLTKLIPLLFLVIALNVVSIMGNGTSANMLSIVFSIIGAVYATYLIGLPMYQKFAR